MRYQTITEENFTVIHDTATGLYWEGKSQEADSEQFCRRQMDWAEFSFDYIDNLNEENFGGFDDWRVPTKHELRSLVNYNTINPAFPQDVFTNLLPEDYWCGNSYGLREDCGWVLNLGLGAATAKHKSALSYGVAVRGEQLPAASKRFVDNGDGTITDNFLHLMWIKEDTERKSYVAIQEMLKHYEFAGYSDWRLPTMHELNSIFDEDFTGGSWFYDEFFKHDKNKPPIMQHLASNLFENTYVWVTNFNFGYDGYYAEKTMPLPYRLVRDICPCDTKFQMPSSGQTETFNGAGKVIGIHLERGKTSSGETKNYIIDFQTGLYYEKPATQKKYTFDEVQEHIQQLNANVYGGKSNWRLPTIDELRFIVDYSKKSPAVFKFMEPYINPDFYWSSEALSAERAWAIYFGYGCSVPLVRSQACFCIAVSGGSNNLADHSPQRYKVEDGTFTDTYTGLMWLREELPLMTACEAEEFLARETLAGYNDWHMPEMKELSTLFNRQSSDKQYLDKNLFPHIYDQPNMFVMARETFNGMFNWGINRNFGYDGYYADRLNGKYIIKPVRRA